MKVIFILGELMMQLSKEASGLTINYAMQVWFGVHVTTDFVTRGANCTSSKGVNLKLLRGPS